MILPLLFLVCFGPLQEPEPTQREPLGRHLRQLENLPQASGLAMDDEGRVWALERNSGRLWRIEPEGQRTLLNGELGRPTDVERGANGELFVTDAESSCVLRLDAAGKILARKAVTGSQLSGLAWTPERIYVTLASSHRVQVLDADGEPLFSFGSHGSDPGQMIAPSDVAVAQNGTIFVADSGNSRVQAFDKQGKFLHEFGDWGPFPGLFFQPSGIEVRGEEVYVADFGNHRVQVFDLKGNLVDRFGLHAIRPREGKGYIHYPTSLSLSPSGEFAAVAEPWVDRVQVFCRTGGVAEDAVRRQAMQLAKPSAHYGMDFACDGKFLFISEPESHSVVVFENSGDDPRRISRLGGLGRKTGLLTGVGGLHYDASKHELWVADPILRRISLYRMPGIEQAEVGFDALLPRFVKSVDLAKLHELELKRWLPTVPEVIAIEKDAAGRLYLLDAANACVIVLAPELESIESIGRGTLQRPTSLAVAADGQTLYVADAGGHVWAFHGAKRQPESIAQGFTPHGLALDEERQFLFATDPVQHRIWRFGLADKETISWGGPGLARNQFYKPRGITLDHRGQLVVLDHGNHRLVRMTVDGDYLATAGPRLYTRLLRYPHLTDKEGAQEEGE